MREQALRFILEQPSGDPSKGNRRKRARLVTACDSCRSKKIKCTPSSDPKVDANVCEACLQGGSPCEFSDRDRYHAERGVSLSDSFPVITPKISSATPLATPSDVPQPPKRRRLSSVTTSSSDAASQAPTDLRFPTSNAMTTNGTPTVSGTSTPPSYESARQRQMMNAAADRPTSQRFSTNSSNPIVANNGPPSGPLKRIIVPFFRYFGPTANTPGYRRIKVRALTLSEDTGDSSTTANDTGAGPSSQEVKPEPNDNGPTGTQTHHQMNGNSSSSSSAPSANRPNPHHQSSDSSSTTTLSGSGGGIPPFHQADSTFPRFSSDLKTQRDRDQQNQQQTTMDAAEYVARRNGSMPWPNGIPHPSSTNHHYHPPPHPLSNSNENLFDPSRPRYPSPVHLPHLTSLFFDYMACHFPFLDRGRVMRQVEEGSLSAVLANCIAGLAIRFSDREEIILGDRQSSGEPYCDMAKLLIVHLLSWPSLEVLQALVLIAWGEFGAGRDSGLWMYSRMAVAMAIDLGLQAEATIQLTSWQEERERVRLTWWAVVLIDRINSWGTGRPIGIGDDQFDTALPTCDVAAGEDMTRAPPPSFVYGHLCRLVQLRGKMGDLLNNQVVRASSNDKRSAEPPGMELSDLQSHMTFFYQSLPPSLLFTMQNFRRFARHEQAATFILLHVMFHSVITLLHRPSLLHNFSPNVALPVASNVDLSRSSARSIVDMVLLASQEDEKALISNPFLDLPILTAARGFLAERDAAPKGSQSNVTSVLRRQLDESNFDKCNQVLDKMSVYWGGVGCVKTILDQQSHGRMDFDVGEGAQPDSRITQLRDVELIKQWATGAWRKQRPNGSSSPVKGRSRAGSPRPSVVPLLPIDHNNHQYGSAALNENSSGSPDDAAIGITGFLDGPLDPSNNSIDWSIDPSGGQEAFRILFNSAEAELSFSNLSSELFSIPEGFEEFLASQTLPYMNGGQQHQQPHQPNHGHHALVSPDFLPQQHMHDGSGPTPGLAALSQAAEQMQPPPSAGQQTATASSHLAIPHPHAHQNIPDYFPVFSSLGLPMPQTLASRAPSPILR